MPGNGRQRVRAAFSAHVARGGSIGVLTADALDLNKRHLAEVATARDRARARHAEAERIATAPPLAARLVANTGRWQPS